jgi:hypothetical protein
MVVSPIIYQSKLQLDVFLEHINYTKRNIVGPTLVGLKLGPTREGMSNRVTRSTNPFYAESRVLNNDVTTTANYTTPITTREGLILHCVDDGA